MPVNDPEQQIQADADELEERIGKLDGRIAEAKQAADARPGETKPLQSATGDPEDDDGDDDDPSELDDPEAEEEEEDEDE